MKIKFKDGSTLEVNQSLVKEMASKLQGENNPTFLIIKDASFPEGVCIIRYDAISYIL